VLAWTSLGERQRRKLLWDNAVACYHRYAGRAAAMVA
jgi:hypothetical protein